MGFPVNSPNDAYRVASMGQDNAATEITPAHWYSGLPSALGTGVVGGLAAVGRTLADFSTSLSDMSPDSIRARDLGLDEEQIQSIAQGPTPVPFTDTIRAVQDWAKTDPRTTGVVGQIGGATVRGLTIFGLGSLLGSPAAGAATLAATEGYNDYADTTEAGIDQNTALKKAGLTATAAGLGAFLPMKVSGRVAMRLAGIGLEAEVAGNQALAQVFYKSAQAAGAMTSFTGRLATGAAVNTGFGMANRYATSQLLESAGYHDMASQYKVLDSEAITADVVLGLAFGGWGHMEEKLNALHRPDRSAVDAALEARKAEMTARGAGGLPTDMATAGLDASLQERALGDLIQGRTPNVSHTEATLIVHGSVLDPERVQLHNDWLNAHRVVYGELADFTPAERIGWADLEGNIPGHLKERFIQDQENSTRATLRVQRELGVLDEQANAILERAQGRLPKIEGQEPTHADMAAALRSHPGDMAEAQRIDVQRQALEAKLAAAQEAVGNTLDKWRAFGAPGQVEPKTHAEFTARFGMEPGKTFEGTPAPPKPGPGAAPEPPAPKAAATEPAAKLSPLVDEQMRQLAARNPDMPVTLPDGSTVKAAELQKAMATQMELAGRDAELFQTAVGCLMRTML